MGESTTLVVDPMRDRCNADRDGRSERGSCRHIAEPVSPEIHPAERHHNSEYRGNHLEIPTPRTGWHEHNHSTNGHCSPNDRVARGE